VYQRTQNQKATKQNTNLKSIGVRRLERGRERERDTRTQTVTGRDKQTTYE